MIHLRFPKACLSHRSHVITLFSLVQITLYLLLNSAPNGQALQLLSKNESTNGSTNQSTSETQHRPAGSSSALAADTQQQSTDLSSLYVQVPIAEPNEANGQGEQTQHSDDKQSATDSADRPTKWTGSWPKKFQIGYIKQSDLHQVLIESLKGDAFTVLDGSAQQQQPTNSSTQVAYGSKSPLATGSSPVDSTPAIRTTASDSSSLMSAGPAKPQLVPAQSAAIAPQSGGQWHRPTMSKNIYRQNRGVFGSNSASMPQRFFGPQQQQQQSYSNSKLPFGRPAPLMMAQQYNMQPQQQQRDTYMGARTPIAMRPSGMHFGGQQNDASPKIISMTGDTGNMYAPAQFQFASNSFKNQPVYATLGGSGSMLQQTQQQQIIEQQMDSLRKQQRPSLMQPPKSYYSSWKPVVSEQTGQVSVGGTKSVAQQPTDSQNTGGLNDGFDDSFAMSHDQNQSNDSMNRHPTLTSYLSNGAQQSQSRRVSPSKRVKQQPSAKGSSSTKSNEPATGTKSKSGPTGNGIKTSDRSGSSSMTTTSSTTTISSGDQPATTNAPVTETSAVDSAANNATTTLATVPTTTMPTSQTQLVPTTTTQSSLSDTEVETSEPDSEVIDSAVDGGSTESPATDVTTQSSMTMTTTTSSSLASTTTTMSSTDASAVEADSRSSTATSNEGNENSTNSGEGRMREETTPMNSGENSKVNPTSASRTGEVEGSTTASSASSSAASATGASSAADDSADEAMDDEALMAAAKSAEIGKANRSQQQQQQQRSNATNAPSGGSKRARSSERIVAQSNAVQSRVMSPSSKLQAKSASLQATGKSAQKQPQQRTAKQMGGSLSTRSKSPASKNASLSKERSSTAQQRQTQSRKASSSPSTKKPINGSSAKANRSGAQQVKRESDRLQSQTQIVSMTAAQAQSTAQTLASLLLARCLSSTNCAHLLDICATKQAAVPLQQTEPPAGSAAAAAPTQQPLVDNASANNQLIGWSVPVGLMSGGLMGLAQALQADRVLRMFPAWKEAVAGVADQESQSGYTLLLPSNEALDRMPLAHLDALQANADRLQQVIEAHILDTAEQLAISTSTQTIKPKPTRLIRDARWPLQVNQHRDRHLTINGKRVIYANQLAPGGGRIHVIDGLLEWPSDQMQPLGSQQQQPATSSSLGVDSNGNNRLQAASQPQQPMDIMETLKQCDKFDGFVTLAEGTGLTQLLKQDGPMTVFVPSNEALRKIPDDELEIIKNNATALKEFLMYHIVNGSYFSQDLRDGQQLASVLDMKPIQVGVRVDGCSRRLVEANTSPMRRPDIVASNGVIHILDWYLTVRDNYWCDSSSTRATGSASSSSSMDSAAASNAELVTMAPPIESTRQSLRARQVAASNVAFESTVSAAAAQSQSQQPQAYSATRITPSIQSVPNNHRPISSGGDVADHRQIGATASNTQTQMDSSLHHATAASSTSQLVIQATPVVPQHSGDSSSSSSSSLAAAADKVVQDSVIGAA